MNQRIHIYGFATYNIRTGSVSCAAFACADVSTESSSADLCAAGEFLPIELFAADLCASGLGAAFERVPPIAQYFAQPKCQRQSRSYQLTAVYDFVHYPTRTCGKLVGNATRKCCTTARKSDAAKQFSQFSGWTLFHPGVKVVVHPGVKEVTDH